MNNMVEPPGMSDECLFARVSCLDLHLEMGCAVGLLPSLFVCSRLQFFGKHFWGKLSSLAMIAIENRLRNCFCDFLILPRTFLQRLFSTVLEILVFDVSWQDMNCCSLLKL